MNTDSNNDEPVEILYIIGSGRSGSTLLVNILGTQKDMVNVGEVYNFRHFFDSIKERDRHCSCGAELDKCPYWLEVDAIASKRASAEKLDLKYGDHESLVSHNHAMLSAIRDITGKRIIIDSSKRFNRLKMLLSSPRFRVTILHLVRDGRAFAFSSMTSALKRNQPHMRYFFRRLLKWQNKNLGVRLAFGHRPNYHLVRYEDFVKSPDGILNRISGWYGLTFDITQLGKQDPAGIHQFSGNSDFISRNSLEIRHDTRYLEQLSTTKWFLATAISLAGLLFFGYSLRRSRCKT